MKKWIDLETFRKNISQDLIVEYEKVRVGEIKHGTFVSGLGYLLMRWDTIR